MKRKILSILCGCLVVFALAGCGRPYSETVLINQDHANGYFTVITEWSDGGYWYKIAYANDTKVKYFIAEGSHRYGITPLYNADGTLQIYEKE